MADQEMPCTPPDQRKAAISSEHSNALVDPGILPMFTEFGRFETKKELNTSIDKAMDKSLQNSATDMDKRIRDGQREILEPFRRLEARSETGELRDQDHQRHGPC